MAAINYTIYLLSLVIIMSCTVDKSVEIPQSSDDATVESPQTDVGTNQEEETKTTNTAVINTRGYIEVPPGQRAAISPYFGGFVKKINVLPGQRVKEGEVILVLQNPAYIEIQQAYLETKEQLQFLKSDAERQKILADENIASRKKFTKVTTDYKVILARYQGLREQIKLMGISFSALDNGKYTSEINILASISGVVSKVNVQLSEFIESGNVMVHLINTDHMHLELDIFESDALKVLEKQKITFRIPETGFESYDGEVFLVGKIIDPTKRTVQVHGHILSNEIPELIPGMFVEAEIIINSP